MCDNKQIVIEGPDQILYQWDTGQRLRLHGYEPGTRVDFARCNQNKAASVYAYAEGGEVFCDIPDAILMEPNHIRGFVYVIDGGKGETVRNFLLPVIPRPKPEDYVEPEEVPTWHELEQRIKKIEDEGVPDEKIERAVEDYLEENPIEAPKPDLTGVVKSVNGKTPDENGNVEITIPDSGGNVDGLTPEVKTALMAVVENIGLWANGDGQPLIDNLRAALYSAPIASITAVYTQTKTVYASDSLEVLRDDLIVTATYTDGTSSVLADYALSGTLCVGTSTVTVSKDGKTTTFTVTVTAARVPATGITLDKTTLSLASSAPVTLTATVTPDNATDSVVWASSEEAVAKVSSDGTVIPVADGSCVISATAGDFTAECSVSVALPLNGLNIGNPYLMNVNSMPSSVAATEEEAQEKWYKALFTAWTSKLGIEKIFFLHPFTNGTFYIRMLGRTLSDPIEFYAFENADIGFNPTATLGKVGDTFTDATVTKFTSFDWVDKDGNAKSGGVDLGEWEYVDGSGSTYTTAHLVLYKITVPENVYVFMSTSEMGANRFPGISENYPLNDLYTIFDKNPSANILQIVE